MSEISSSISVAVGRRKCAIARVRIAKGDGKIVINNIDSTHYLQYSPKYLQYLKEPLALANLETELDIHVNVIGGGIAGQTGAIRLGIARAICKINSDHRGILKAEGCLTRDARVKERKKYGLKKARKAPQYSKR
uniref:ribosomal protein S9 n=1 Tax=Goniotrichopsis reniformis TaxID=468933 RepID=UPI001FCDC959|nr:ribosomal protein S9 [Goniotrichopsis reniformis]UNJ14783.1 ribosomal protein S9 [Goniotrichopsis reniformis]